MIEYVAFEFKDELDEPLYCFSQVPFVETARARK